MLGELGCARVVNEGTHQLHNRRAHKDSLRPLDQGQIVDLILDQDQEQDKNVI